MKNLDVLLQDAKFKQLTNCDIEQVVEKIKASTPGNDSNLYALIYILGKGAGPEYKTIVEPFLYYPSNPMVSSIALLTLCSYWSLAQEYLAQLKVFLRGVEWDIDDNVRYEAINCAGTFLRNAQEKDIEIIQILQNLLQNETDEFLGEVAFISLARGVGKEWSEILDVVDPNFGQSVFELMQEHVNKGKMEGNDNNSP